MEVSQARRLMNHTDLGFILLVLAIVFGAVETIYFGCNWSPGSQAEMVCDCIALALCLIGLGLVWIGKNL